MINSCVLSLFSYFPVHPVSYDDGMNAQQMGINTPAGVFPDYWKIMLYVCDFVV